MPKPPHHSCCHEDAWKDRPARWLYGFLIVLVVLLGMALLLNGCATPAPAATKNPLTGCLFTGCQGNDPIIHCTDGRSIWSQIAPKEHWTRRQTPALCPGIPAQETLLFPNETPGIPALQIPSGNPGLPEGWIRYTDCYPQFGPRMTCRRMNTEFWREFECLPSRACTKIRDLNDSAHPVYQRVLSTESPTNPAFVQPDPEQMYGTPWKVRWQQEKWVWLGGILPGVAMFGFFAWKEAHAPKR